MKLKNAQEFADAVPAGRYPAQITQAEATISSGGSPMIKLTGALTEGEYAGRTFYDNMITDDAFKGAGIGKRKLRGLGIGEVDADVEIADVEICQRLLGLNCLVDLVQEQMMEKDANGKYTKGKTALDANGALVKVMKNVPNAYYTTSVGAVAAQAPVLHQAPIQAQAPQQFAPPAQFAQPVQQQYVQPTQPQQFAPQAPVGQGGFAPNPGQGYAQPMQQAPVQQFIPQAQPQYAQPGFAPQQQAVAPWAVQGAPQGAPAQLENGAPAASKGRKGKSAT